MSVWVCVATDPHLASLDSWGGSVCAKRAQTLVSDDEPFMALCEEPGELGQLLAVTSREELVSDLEKEEGLYSSSSTHNALPSP